MILRKRDCSCVASGVGFHHAKKHLNFITEIYPVYFDPFKNDKITLLEIGVKYGASLRVWKDFFPNGLIYGIDIEKSYALTEDRIKTFTGSQADTKFLKKIVKEVGKFDFIIDDGSHLSTDQITSFDYLFEHGLKAGGTYFIEDMDQDFGINTSKEHKKINGGQTTEMLKEYIVPLLKSVRHGNPEAIAFLSFYNRMAVIGKKQRGGVGIPIHSVQV